MAHIVPMGMLFWASARSPDRLDPAMMPNVDWLEYLNSSVCEMLLTCDRWEEDADKKGERRGNVGHDLVV